MYLSQISNNGISIPNPEINYTSLVPQGLFLGAYIITVAVKGYKDYQKGYKRQSAAIIATGICSAAFTAYMIYLKVNPYHRYSQEDLTQECYYTLTMGGRKGYCGKELPSLTPTLHFDHMEALLDHADRKVHCYGRLTNAGYDYLSKKFGIVYATDITNLRYDFSMTNNLLSSENLVVNLFHSKVPSGLFI